ncbi:MAG: competence protein ComEC, partial [Thermosipho sp. (in: thermotogales)]|nr:competence protein ComEC [Thermosipho sp. (in: thermotogales)]
VILFEKLIPKMSKIDILSIVGLLFLFFQPFLAYSLSFYMTFFSTFGILSVENNKLKPLAAFLGCAPFLSLFSNVNIFSIIGTFVLIIPFQIILTSLMIAYFFYILNFSLVVDFILKINLPITKFIEFISVIFSRFPKIHGGIITYFLFSVLFFAFLLHFGQIPYILKSKSSN